MNSLLISPEVPSLSSLLISDAPTPDNTGRVLTKRVQAKERSTVILSFKSVEANAMRAFIKSIRLKGDKAPSQSLVARRALQVYLHRLELLRREAPTAYEEEVAALERMVTPAPQATQVSRKKLYSGYYSPQPAREDQRKAK